MRGSAVSLRAMKIVKIFILFSSARRLKVVVSKVGARVMGLYVSGYPSDTHLINIYCQLIVNVRRSLRDLKQNRICLVQVQWLEMQ